MVFIMASVNVNHISVHWVNISELKVFSFFVQSEVRKMYQSLLEQDDNFEGFALAPGYVSIDPDYYTATALLVLQVMANLSCLIPTLLTHQQTLIASICAYVH